MASKVQVLRAEIDAEFRWLERMRRKAVDAQRLADGPEEDVA